MAYQPKSYRKFLAGTITAAVVASAVAPAASAAEVKFTDLAGLDAETNTAIETLVGLEVIKGYPDGTFKPNQTINRGQAAEMTVKALKLETPAPTGKVFEDLTDKSYYAKFAEALATAKLIPAGGKFGAGTDMTREAMAVALVTGFGLKDNGKTVEVKDLDAVAPEARDAVKILAQHDVTKLLDGKFNPKDAVKRSQFALFFYRGVAAAGLVQTGEQKVVAAAANSAKSIKVDLGKQLTSLEGLTFSVKRGTAIVVLDAKLSEDKKSVILSSPVNLSAGDYTVTVTGGEFKTGTNVATVKVEAEKETSLTITSNSVSKSATGKIDFEVKNQYGEVMAIPSNQVVATAFDKTAKADGTGTGLITLAPVAGKQQLQGDFSAATVAHNDEIVLTLSYKGLSASKTITAQDLAAISNITLNEVVPATGKTRVVTGDRVEVKYTAVDQYNKAFTLPAYNDAAADDKVVIGDFQITSSNPTVVDADSIQVDNAGKLTILAGAAGTAKLFVTNFKTATITTLDVTVASPSAADAITLTAPNTLVAAGEEVKVAYTVVDQFGATITPANLNTGSVVLSTSNAGVATAKWVGKEIVVTGVAAGTAEISATIGTKVVKFSIDIQAAAVATKVVGVKDVASLYENTATSSLDFSKILVKDQYGRDYKLKNGDDVTVTVKDQTPNGVTSTLVDSNADAKFNNTSDTVTFTGTADKSVEVYTVAINGVAGSSYDLSLASVATADVTSYELKAVGTIYGVAGQTAASAHAVSLDLVGKNAEGKEVALVAGKITNITSSNKDVVSTDLATKKVFGLAEGTATVAVWNGVTKLAQVEVTASKVAPVLTTATFATKEVNKLTTDADFTVTGLTFKDQYGVAIAGTGVYSSSNTAVATVTAAGVVDIVGAGTATIGFVTTNGVLATFTLTVQ
jgi:trimeric autotransporter adhesin